MGKNDIRDRAMSSIIREKYPLPLKPVPGPPGWLYHAYGNNLVSPWMLVDSRLSAPIQTRVMSEAQGGSPCIVPLCFLLVAQQLVGVADIQEKRWIELPHLFI